jgi:GNAT superfamily N-acetyltransferase
VVDPELIWFAEAEGRPVGVFLNLPDPGPLLKRLNGRMGLKGLIAFLLHAKGVKDVRAAVIGVLEEFAGRGIASALMVKAFHVMHHRGFRTLEWSWVMEGNGASMALIAKFGGTRYKTYRVYEKELPDPRAPVPLG